MYPQPNAGSKNGYTDCSIPAEQTGQTLPGKGGRCRWRRALVYLKPERAWYEQQEASTRLMEGAAAEAPAPVVQEHDKREVGGEAVWSLSTAKPGNGVEQLRDDNNDTYWQSDGQQPHLINIQFHKKMTLVEVAFYLDYKLDESYTPKKISIRAGTTFHDLAEIHSAELTEPSGWVTLPLMVPQEPSRVARAEPEPLVPLRAWFVQVCVVSMHQNGRDTHIRQVKVFGERGQQGGRVQPGETEAFSMFHQIR